MDVMVVGGGVAGLEALIALRNLARERVTIQLVTPEPEFAYRPLAVAEPFGADEAGRYDLMRIAHDHGAALRLEGVAGVDSAAHEVVTWGGGRLPFEVL